MAQIWEFVVQVISSASIGGAAAGLIVWLSRLWLSERIKNTIKNEYDSKLESHKAQLKAQSDVEIEKLRSQLHIASMEHEVRFSRLHEKRAEVISETYGYLRDLYVCLGEYVKIYETSNDPPKQERFDELVKAQKKFFESYSRRLIFFPKRTADRLEEINQEFVRTGNEFTFKVVRNTESGNYTGEWFEIFERVSKEMRETLRDLETEFRNLLGDENITDR